MAKRTKDSRRAIANLASGHLGRELTAEDIAAAGGGTVAGNPGGMKHLLEVAPGLLPQDELDASVFNIFIVNNRSPSFSISTTARRSAGFVLNLHVPSRIFSL
jgi:hypothetical protein